MSLSALQGQMDIRESEKELNNVVHFSKPEEWLQKARDGYFTKAQNEALKYTTSVHPCVINGKRTLVYQRSLKQQNPTAYFHLNEFAEANGFALKEDQRSNLKSVRNERRSKIMPMMALGAGLFMGQAATSVAAADDDYFQNANISAETEVVEVIGERESSKRKYLLKDGKRFISGPFGEMEAILAVSAEVKSKGKLKRVRTRGIKMPNTYSSSFINRYDYSFPENCGGAKYSYYEGEGFGALGYHDGKKVVLDVMVGGGPFAAPKLWGPYDQVLNDNMKMDLMMGDGSEDGMGLLKASYAIGLMPVADNQTYQAYGTAYTENTIESMQCLDKTFTPEPKQPILREAKLDNEDENSSDSIKNRL